MPEYIGSTLTIITSTNNPYCEVGQVLPGWYTYASASIDGIFLFAPDKGRLCFALGCPTKPMSTDNYVTNLKPGCAFTQTPLLRVENGKVVDVRLSFEGGVAPYHYHGNFTLTQGNPASFRIEIERPSAPAEGILACGGTIVFGQPLQIPPTPLLPLPPSNARTAIA